MSAERLTSPEKLIDRPASDVVAELVRINPQIETLFFARYFPNNKDEPDLFWHFSREEVLHDNKVQWLVSEKLVYEDSLIGFASLVEVTRGLPPPGYIRLGHEWQHIPILFLTPPPGHEQDQITQIRELIRNRLGQRWGWILHTPQTSNYYYCGTKLLPPDQWQTFMLQAKGEGANKGIIPEKYIDLALMPKITRQSGVEVQAWGLSLPYATLRISTNLHCPHAPCVVDVL